MGTDNVTTVKQYLQQIGETQWRSVELRTAVIAKLLLGLQFVAVLVILAQLGGAPVPDQVSAPIVFLALTFVPGGLVVLLVSDNVRIGARHVLYAFGLSLILIMAIGFAVNVTLPIVGYDTPMARVPLTASTSLVALALASPFLIGKQEKEIRIDVPPVLSPVPLFFLLVPLLAITGVGVLNRTGNNVLITIALIVIAFVPLFVVVKNVRPAWHSLGIWTLSLAVLLHKALWKFSGYSGQPYAYRTWRAQLWSPGVFEASDLSASLLPNGVLYPIYARLTGVHILTQYNVINPVFVSFLPVALFVAFRSYTDSYKAFLGASVFVFAHPFFRQYPTAGRAATPVLFLALFALVISDKESSPIFTSGLSLIFLAGIVVSHYGTSYFVLATLILALLSIIVLRWVDNVIKRRALQKIREIPAEVRSMGSRAGARVSISLALFFFVGTIGWYLFVKGGRKFEQLPKHVVGSLLQLTGGPTVSGRTAARIQREYGGESIQYAKFIYVVVGLLMAIGLLSVLYRRLSSHQTDFDDYYFTMAGASLAIFGMTILVRNWGGGRPMMITYVFSVIFAVVGLASIGNYLTNNDRGILAIFGVLLVALFVLNSGVASVLVFGGFAPSNVPGQPSLDQSTAPRAQTIVYQETDISTHVWMINHYEDMRVYGDTYANRQTDWYRPQIIAGTDGDGWGPIEPRAGKPLGLARLAQPGIESGSLLILGHNLALNGVWVAQYGPPEASLDELELSDRNKIYSTGESEIYHFNES